MSSNLYSHIWGAINPDIIFYLPTAPNLPEHWQATDIDAIAQLVALNGNHWRKIVTIMAKLCCIEHDINAYKGKYWKLIRDNLLSEANELQQSVTHKHVETKIKITRLRCQLRIVKPHVVTPTDFTLSTKTRCWHLVCGNETQSRLNITRSQQYNALDEKQKIQYQHMTMLTPYLDYRQFSNTLIELTRQHIAATKR
ncbi:DUF6942 family protein [Shewanella sp. A14]